MSKAKSNRRPLLVSDEEAAAIDEYRWQNRVPSFAEAVRQLIAKGLAAEGASKQGEAA